MSPVEATSAAGAALNFQSNPFVMLTFIVAPAVLTNGSALMAMSTSNRFARAIDRARELAKQIEESRGETAEVMERLVWELTTSENRALLLVKALRSFYWSLASFALVTLVSLLGALLTAVYPTSLGLFFLIFVLAVGFSAVGGLVIGALLLLRETRMVMTIIHKRNNRIRSRKWPLAEQKE
jgi:hypothetical protein